MAERGSVREITNDEGKRSCGAVEPWSRDSQSQTLACAAT